MHNSNELVDKQADFICTTTRAMWGNDNVCTTN